MTVRRYGTGWRGIVKNLEYDLDTIAPDLIVREVSEGKFGELKYYYDLEGLDVKQANWVADRVNRAVNVALETCVECGAYGRIRYTNVPAIKGRVYCDEHTPEDWKTLNG